MTYLDTSHVQPSRSNDVFLIRLADQEARKIGDRLSTYGIKNSGKSRFEKSASIILSRAAHEEPRQLREDIAALADRSTRAAMSQSRRTKIFADVVNGMSRSAGLVRDKSLPVDVQNPFENKVILDNEADPELV
jgi:hypothetical protein